MNKTELIAVLAERFSGDKRAASYALEAVLDTVTRSVVSGNRVTILGFGTFESRERAARMVRNPRTGATSEAPAKKVVRFAPGTRLRAVVAGEQPLAEFVGSVPPGALVHSTPSVSRQTPPAPTTPAAEKATQSTAASAKPKKEAKPSAKGKQAKPATPAKSATSKKDSKKAAASKKSKQALKLEKAKGEKAKKAAKKPKTSAKKSAKKKTKKSGNR